MGGWNVTRGLRSNCPVCGGREVARDEVFDPGVLLLAACHHCDHRWTERPARAIAAQHRDVEIVSAA
jgi:uncharacterized protein (DUF983 family)